MLARRKDTQSEEDITFTGAGHLILTSAEFKEDRKRGQHRIKKKKRHAKKALEEAEVRDGSKCKKKTKG